MKLDAEEKEQLESVEHQEWKSAPGGKRERARYSRYAKATFRKDRRLNIRVSRQGPGGDPEVSARGGPAVPDADLELAAQARVGQKLKRMPTTIRNRFSLDSPSFSSSRKVRR